MLPRGGIAAASQSFIMPNNNQILRGACVALLTVMGAGAAMAELSMADRIELFRRSYPFATDITGISKMPAYAAGDRVAAFVTLSDGMNAAKLEKEGVHVAKVLGNLAMITMPASDAERVSNLKGVNNLALSRKRNMLMDKARAASGVDAVHKGTELDQPYTGKGVIVGVVDQGLDPNHINFRDDAGQTRFKYLTHITENRATPEGYLIDYYGSDVLDAKDITEFTTDEAQTYHGTHTLGILTGSYGGKLTTTGGEEIANPYMGVAPGAEIAASCGDLMDMYIAMGVAGILDYADYAQKPAVVSLSLGSNTGSHSERAYMNRVLDTLGEESILVISAGNEGDMALACKKTLTAEDTELKTIIRTLYSDPTVRYGEIYVYSQEDFDLQAVTVNRNRGKIAYRMPIAKEGEYSIYEPASIAESGAIASTQFEQAFSSGYVVIGKYYDDYTQEYVGMISYYTVDNEKSNDDFNYLLGYVVSGHEGQRIESYAGDGLTELTAWGLAGWDNGTYDGTINDMACGLNTISVGSYNTRDTYPVIDGEASYEGMFPDGDITFYSSWGTLADGRQLPDVCAPGAAIVSSTNTYFMDSLDEYTKYLNNCASMSEDGRVNYWGPSHGTSMATPYVAGGIALWLEADPSLKVEDVRDIIAQTATKDEQVLGGNPVRWGAGKFNAIEGLKEVIRRKNENSVSRIGVGEDNVIVTRNGDSYTFFAGGARGVTVEIYTTSGAKVAAYETAGDEITVPTGALAHGIYVARINNQVSKKITI